MDGITRKRGKDEIMFTKKVLARVVAILAASMMIVSIAGCGKAEKKPQITIEVTDPSGNTSSFTGVTDAEFLHGAIDDIDGVTIDGYDSDWGYYITTVNGIEANYDTDGAYWSIYVNGGYGENGIDTQPIADGDTYAFVYEVYQAN